MKGKRTLRMLGIFGMLCIAVMLASCSSDEVLQGTNESAKNVVTFTATLDDGMETRAGEDDNNASVNAAIVEVYSDADATQKVARVTVDKGTDGKFTFSIPDLNEGQEYTFLFWAYNDMNGIYDANDLKNVTLTVPFSQDVAYSLATTLTPEEISQQGVQLKHAVAKVTMQTTTDLTTSDEIFLYCPMYRSFNVLTNSATGTPDTNTYIRFGNNNRSAGETMRSDYVFGTNETQTVSIQYGSRPTRKTITNVPLNPNKHVILKGDYTQIGLTNASFAVSLDVNWGDESTESL